MNRLIVLFCVLFSIISSTTGLFIPYRFVRQRSLSASSRAPNNLSSRLYATTSKLDSKMRNNVNLGRHGDGFKYMPIHTATSDEHYPRIIPIAGVYPDVSVEQILAPKTTPAPTQGQWAYEFTDPDGSQLGTVALPGSDLLALAVDPVILISKSTDLNILVKEETESLLVVDRGDKKFVSGEFFLFLTPQNTISALWMEDLEEGYDIIGRIVVCAMPFTESMRPKPTGFAEEDE